MGSSQSVQINRNLSMSLAQVNSPTLLEHLKHDYWLIAFKNPSSYMIISQKLGMVLVEDGALIWEKKFGPKDTQKSSDYLDLKYIAKENCYLIYHNKHILYRKDISKANANQILKLESGGFSSKQSTWIRYSQGLERLILFKGVQCHIFNLSTSKILTRLEADFRGPITNYQVYGPNEDKMLAVTWAGLFVAYDLSTSPSSNPKITQIYDFAKEETRNVHDECAGPFLSICEKSKYAVTQFYDQEGFPSYDTSRFLVFRLGQKEGETPLTLIANLDVYRKFGFPSSFWQLDLLNRADEDGSLILFGTSAEYNKKPKTKIHFFELSLENKNLRYCNRWGNQTEAESSRRIISFDGSFYSVTNDQGLEKLEFNSK